MTARHTVRDGEHRPTEGLESLGRVLSELVHDLASDLVVLQGWAQVARGEADAGRAPATELDRVVELSGSVGAMLRDVLSVAEGRTASPEVGFAPRAVTEAALAQRVRELASLTVRFRTDVAGEATVRGFASFWSRILSNLLSNAARHARSQVLVRLEAVDQEVVLRVEDDGVGVGPGDRERVFEPLWTAEGGSGGGIGLGLSSVSWLAGRLGGSAACVDPRELTGAAFEVRVPLAVAPVRVAAGGSVREIIGGSRFLLVDDDSAVRHALSRLLTRVGAEVRELDPHLQTDDAVVEAVIAAVPDVVLLDLRLGRRGGADLWQKLVARLPALALRTVFVTGAGPGDADWDVAASTGQPVLGKPFALQELADCIERLG